MASTAQAIAAASQAQTSILDASGPGSRYGRVSATLAGLLVQLDGSVARVSFVEWLFNRVTNPRGVIARGCFRFDDCVESYRGRLVSERGEQLQDPKQLALPDREPDT